jgi:glutamyl/glutaminyl-tRNA synthetase
MTASTVITRFAPSPTGDLHIGGARTALFCWALARRHHGRFLIRLEDTDRARSSRDSARAILDDLAWLGLTWDDGPTHEVDGSTVGGDDRNVGPFNQSERLDLYNHHLERLLERGLAYPAFDSPEELAARRDEAQKAKRTFIYRRGDDDDRDAAMKRMRDGEPCVIRFAADPERAYTVRDEVLGEVTYAPGELEDFVICKADGFPTYHFAVVVDDALMGVTHVLRGQEHFSNTPKHIALQDALGFPNPVYAHMPLIFNDRGAKMSKRERDQAAREHMKSLGATEPPGHAIEHDRFAAWLGDKKMQLEPGELAKLAVAAGLELPEVSVADFRAAGYLPEVIVNFIALLGFTPSRHDDGSEREKFDLEFLAQDFAIDRIGRSNARFDRKKLLAFNTDAITGMDQDAFVARFDSWLKRFAPDVTEALPDASLGLLARAVQPQSKTFADAADRCRFALQAPTAYDEKGAKKFLHKNEGEGLDALRRTREELASIEETRWSDPDGLHEAVSSFAERVELGMGKVAQPLRLALTGTPVSPSIGPTLSVLGKAETLARIDACLAHFNATS